MSAARSRRGVAAVLMVVVLLVLNLIVVTMVLGGARDSDLIVHRVDTLQAFYAAEAGANMAMREIMEDSDEDGDGGTGTISDDDDDGTDPAVGFGYVAVTQTAGGGQSTLTSKGRAGGARRTIQAVLED